MMAVFRHELRSSFHSMTAYVFAAFLLAMIGVGAMLYNIELAVSNFEYVLSFGSLAFVVVIPILTMRSLAEERRQKTDQLLYSLPLSTFQVILGKYAALLVLYEGSLLISRIVLGKRIKKQNEELAREEAEEEELKQEMLARKKARAAKK